MGEKELLLLHAKPKLLKVWEDLVPKLSSHLKKHHIYHLVLFKSSDSNCNAALSESALGGAAAIIKKRFVAERTHTETSVSYFIGVWVEERHTEKEQSWNNRSKSSTGVKKTQYFGRQERRTLELCLDVGTTGCRGSSHSEAFISWYVMTTVHFKSPEALCLLSIRGMWRE